MIKEHTVYYFSYFKYVDICFVTQDMVKLGECSMDTLKEFVLCNSLVECSVDVTDPVG